MRLFSSFRKGTVELKKLREEILSSIEYSGIGGNAFRPAGQVDKFLAVDRVSIILSRKASDVLVEFVCQNAKKIFLALVLCGDACSANDLASIMQSCHVYGMSDEQLPVPEMSCIGIGGSGHCLTKHNSSLDVLHDGRWRAIMYRFRVDQYTINPPVFNDEGLVYKLAAGCVLPFISNDLNKRDGHHFTVVEAILHQDHYVTVCDGSRAASQKPVRVALNKMKHLDGELRYNAREAWGREVAALKEIRGFGHKHFVRFLAAMEHGSECYAMFEWADGGSLRDVWKNDGAEYLTADRVICVLEELLGLAGALATLHNKNKTTAELASRATPRELRDRPGANRPPRPAVSSPSIRQPVRAVLLQLPKIHVQRDRSEDEFDIYSDMDRRYISDDIDLDQEVHWRHGDLSPDKILHCKDTSADRWLGTLKIAGLGRAKQHFMATSQRYEQTQQRYIASQYEAPEAMANLWSPRSRRYDIWSMGCIFLEFVIFLLYGSKGLDAFYGERESKQISTGTLYFTLTFDQDTAEVSGTAKYWINSILQESECCREGSAIADLVVLIRDRLLVVDLPESTMKQDQRDVCRADAGELQSRLEKIWKMALDSEAKGGNYLLAQPIRAHSLIPRPSGVEDRKFGRDGVNYWKVPGREQQKYQETYTYAPLNGAWKFWVDNDFAISFFRDCDDELVVFPEADHHVALCNRCSQINSWTLNTIMSFGRGANDCRLHELVFRVCSPMLLNNNPVIEIRRVGSNLFLDKHYFPILSLSTPPPMPMHSPASGDNQAGQGAFDVQIGFPDLQLFRNSKYFALLSYWLQDCDCNHSQCARTDDAPIPGRPLLPTRLIDVGQGDLITGRGSTTLRLIVTAAIPEDELKADARYIALSHPWGSNRDHDHFCTTRLNLDSRVKDGMAMDSLPATLRDAVVVTRALGVRYLWIDTICIIQGENGDFNTEAPLMETVFSLAHCVIAASSAGGTSSGFLSRQRSSRDFVTLSQKENHHGPDTNATLYIGEVIDNFQKHVIEGPLNKRGWVLQERALARRTIYFTQWQTYFECGAGIRCETLAKMTSNQAAFLGDPNFPSVALKSSKGARIRLYELLYKSYSALEFTNPCDRPIAIAGLEQRLVKAFNTHGGYGVFDGPFFGRGLLWKRDENVPRNVMRPIEVSLHKGSYYVPTWSWMAYEGVITFMDAPLDTVEWQHGTKDGLVSPWATLPEPGDTASPSASVIWHTGKTDEHTVLKAKAREFSVPLSKVETKIVYDAGETPRKDVGEVKCVIVGRQRMSESQPIPSTLLPHYVLVVGQRQKSDVRTEYERLGVAVLPGDWIDQGGGGKEIWIV